MELEVQLSMMAQCRQRPRLRSDQHPWLYPLSNVKPRQLRKWRWRMVFLEHERESGDGLLVEVEVHDRDGEFGTEGFELVADIEVETSVDVVSRHVMATAEFIDGFERVAVYRVLILCAVPPVLVSVELGGVGFGEVIKRGSEG